MKKGFTALNMEIGKNIKTLSETDESLGMDS